jgi:Uri superfamily endonuclease
MSGNIEANGESLTLLDIGGETSAEGAGRSRDVECRKRDRRERRWHADHLTPQFLIVIQKDYNDDISRREARVRARN